MIREYHQIYEDMIVRLTKKNSPDISNVKKAFAFAEEKHSGQFRKSGEPYILHPICVAEILEKLNFDTDVISAAILHDVIEDCEVSHNQLEKEFNSQIAEIVEAVTAITNETYKPDFENLYSNPQDFLKLAIEDKTYQKLISMGKSNKFAFYIKFADRIHNLSTISVFARHKILAKIEETEKWIIPITILLKSRYFSLTLKNLCFKAKYDDGQTQFFDNYNKRVYSLEKPNKFKKVQLGELLNDYIQKNKIKQKLSDIIIQPKTEREVFKLICKKFDILSLKKTKQSNLSFVPTHNIYFIFDTDKNQEQTTALLLDIFTKSSQTLYKVCGIETDEFANTFITITDNKHNLYSCIALSRSDYTRITNGTTEGTDIDDIDETNTGKIVTSFINVLTRSGQTLRLPKNSTVLDFAFKIHNELGFSVKYALINGAPTKMPIYTKLHDGDKIEVFNEIGEDGLIKNISQLRWLMYTENESTQKTLIKYFEKKYGEK